VTQCVTTPGLVHTSKPPVIVLSAALALLVEPELFA